MCVCRSSVSQSVKPFLFLRNPSLTPSSSSSSSWPRYIPIASATLKRIFWNFFHSIFVRYSLVSIENKLYHLFMESSPQLVATIISECLLVKSILLNWVGTVLKMSLCDRSISWSFLSFSPFQLDLPLFKCTHFWMGLLFLFSSSYQIHTDLSKPLLNLDYYPSKSHPVVFCWHGDLFRG